MNDTGSVDPNAPVQADPGDEGDGVFDDPGPYMRAPESLAPIDGAPAGELSDTQTFRSPAVFEDWTFEYRIYVPPQYEDGKPAALAVFQDGFGAYGGIGVTQVFENLIHAGEMPVTIGLFIEPGDDENGNEQRGLIYDTVSERYGQMLIEEMIPEVLADYDLVDDADGWSIAGFSSGGSAAFTVAWFWPDDFHKVFTNSGSFTALRGADIYPQLVRETDPPLPLRVTLRSGTADLDNQFGNWLEANEDMAEAFEERDYHYRFVHGTGGHSMEHNGQGLAEELRWLWRGYSLPYYD